MVARQIITAADFDQISSLPENADRRLELVWGVVVEVVSNNYLSETAANLLGRVTGADGGSILPGFQMPVKDFFPD
jgi:hypothetical protein